MWGIAPLKLNPPFLASLGGEGDQFIFPASSSTELCSSQLTSPVALGQLPANQLGWGENGGFLPNYPKFVGVVFFGFTTILKVFSIALVSTQESLVLQVFG